MGGLGRTTVPRRRTGVTRPSASRTATALRTAPTLPPNCRALSPCFGDPSVVGANCTSYARPDSHPVNRSSSIDRTSDHSYDTCTSIRPCSLSLEPDQRSEREAKRGGGGDDVGLKRD